MSNLFEALKLLVQLSEITYNAMKVIGDKIKEIQAENRDLTSEELQDISQQVENSLEELRKLIE